MKDIQGKNCVRMVTGFIKVTGMFLFFIPHAQAQFDFGRALNQPGLYIDYYFAPAAALKDANVNVADTKIGYHLLNLSGDFNMLHLNPHNSGKVTHITGELSFRYHRFHTEGIVTNALPEAVYGIDYLVAATHTFNSRWSVIGVASLGIFSDFEKISLDDFLVSGGVLGVFTVNTHLHVGIGPILTYVFGEAMLLPLPYVNWYFGKKMLLDIQAPTHAILHYNVSELLHFKLATRFTLGTKYNVTLPADEANLLFSEGTVGLEAQIQSYDNFAFWIRFSHTFYRRLALSYEGGFNPEIIPGQDYDLKQQFLPSAGLSWWF